jgi:hypothetical protein
MQSFPVMMAFVNETYGSDWSWGIVSNLSWSILNTTAKKQIYYPIDHYYRYLSV